MTPTVEARWAFISTPDTKYNKDGIYQIDLMFDKTIKEHAAFLNALRDMLPNGATNKPWKVDPEDPNLLAVKCKQNAKVGKFEFKPRVFDMRGTPIKEVPLIGNGTTVNVQVELRPYDMQGGGVRLNPVAIQIVKLVEFKEESSPEADSPFGVVEGDFAVETFSDLTVGAPVVEDEDDFGDF